MVFISFIYGNFTITNISTKSAYCPKILKMKCMSIRFITWIFSLYCFFYFFNFIKFNFCFSVNVFSAIASLIDIFLGNKLFVKIVSPCSLMVFICFSNALPRGEYVNFNCSIIILLWSDGNISSPVRYSYLSIFPDDNVDISAASRLILYCSFPSLILPSIVMINFYTVSKRFFVKRGELSAGRVISIIKKRIWFYSRHFIKIHKSWKSISNEWLNAICWSSLLFGIFITK